MVYNAADCSMQLAVRMRGTPSRQLTCTPWGTEGRDIEHFARIGYTLGPFLRGIILFFSICRLGVLRSLKFDT